MFQNFHSSWKNVSRNLAASGAVLGSTGLCRSAANDQMGDRCVAEAPLIVWLLLKLPSERRTRKGCWRPVETSTGQLFTHIGMTNIKIFVRIFMLFFPQVAMQRISRSQFQTERRSASSTSGLTFCLTLSNSLRVSGYKVVELSPMPQVPSKLGSLK